MYKTTIEHIEQFDFADKANKDYQYLLWMCGEIKTMTDPFRAGRWIGYVNRMVEELGFWDNVTTRTYIREDVISGNDR